MNGKLSDDQLHVAFQSMYEAYVRSDESNIKARIHISEDFLKLYYDIGGMGWFNLYEMEVSQLISTGMDEIAEIANLPLPKESANAEDLFYVISRVEELNAHGSDFDDNAARAAAMRKYIPFVLSQRCLLVNFVSFVRFQKSVIELIHSTISGNQESFINLVKLDLIFLQAPLATKHLIDIETSISDGARIALGKAIEPDSIFWNLSKSKEDVALIIAAVLGVLDRSYPDIADFFSYHNLEKLENPPTLAKRLERLGIYERKPYPKARKNLDK